ncbi:PREDICTED: PHD and RING finger domain-containing protein 1-like, partial [Condylura cristata]|uniref:PHD and RING finger domain-containing protein 1-like n=1 Tax=Condylura cristata TaxID=143302 RepID=UPI000643E093
RRRKAPGRKKAPSRAPGKSRGSGVRLKRRQSRVRKSRASRTQHEATARSRLARTLGLRRPARGACAPSLHKPAEPSLGLMRADIGAAPLSLFGDPYELDPFDSGEAPPGSPSSPLHTKRRALSRSALRAGPEPQVDAAPEPDLLGSILCGQSLLMLSGADVTIHRDGSLSARRAAPVSSQRDLAALPGRGRGQGFGDNPQPGGPCPGNSCGQQGAGPSPSCAPAVATGATVRPGPAAGPPGPGHAQNVSTQSTRGFTHGDTPCLVGSGQRPPPLGPATSQVSEGSPDSPSQGAGPAPAPRVSCRGKGVGSTFESFRINIPGNTAQAGRPPNPGFCNTFRPVDSKAPRKEAPAPLFSIRKARQLKSEMYDPFDPTGSDSSSPTSSPERLGPGLLPAEITRTISVDSPAAPQAQAVRCVTSYTVEAPL